MRGQTQRAILVSFGLHIAVLITLSPFLVNRFGVEKGSISADILKEPEAADRRRHRVLPTRAPVMPTSQETEASPASPSVIPAVGAPRTPIRSDIPVEIAASADLPLSEAPSPVAAASSGAGGIRAGPVAIAGQGGTGVGGPGRGGYGIGDRFAGETGAAEAGLDTLDAIETGIGIFDTDVMPGHGLSGEVYVPGGPIYRMPHFEALTPIYTFVTSHLNIPVRDYRKGFPTPELQSVVEDFAIRFRGELAIETPARYVFGLYADDGAKLYINGNLVVDNDGIHEARGESGSIFLAAGRHPVEIHYFQGPRYLIALQWYYQQLRRTDSSRSGTPVKWNRHHQPWTSADIVPPEMIYRSRKPRIPAALRKLQQRLNRINESEK